jgi:hypothetical protein
VIPVNSPDATALNTHDRYILDPLLVLSPHGLLIAKHLSMHAEIWIAHELWLMLQNAQSYINQPPLTAIPDLEGLETEKVSLVSTLQNWQHFLASTPPHQFPIYWLGDTLWESRLPSTTSITNLSTWTTLNLALEQLTPPSSPPPSRLSEARTLLDLALQDTLALAAYLESVTILAHYPAQPNQSASTPLLCQHLARWQIPCQHITTEPPWIALEREMVNTLLVKAGIAKLCWQDLNLALVHLIVPTSQKDSSALNIWPASHSFWYEL